MPVPISQILSRARALITDPALWTQRAWARDAQGDPTDPVSPLATCWCSAGAILRVGVAEGWRRCAEATAYLERACGWTLVSVWSDCSEHGEVLEVFDRAIAAAMQDEGAAA